MNYNKDVQAINDRIHEIKHRALWYNAHDNRVTWIPDYDVTDYKPVVIPDYKYENMVVYESKSEPVEVKPVTQEVAKRSQALIRPEDITDAVDSRDLLDTVLAQNLERITAKVDKRVTSKWVGEAKETQRARYTNQARGAYQKMWEACGSSSVGHNFRMMEVRGYNVEQCQDCAFAGPSTKSAGPSRNREARIATDMNNDMMKAMAERMIEVDIEAGLFAWPTNEDYPNIVSKGERMKPRKLFGRR